MLQTEKYKFNIIETTDTFSPDALNANARTAEAELDRVEAKAAADKAELQADDAVIRANLGSGGKNARIKCGSYVGDGQCARDHPTTLTLDFTPHFVFVSYQGFYAIMHRGGARGVCLYSNHPTYATWEERSVSWYADNADYQCNGAGNTYHYIVIGESL